MSLGGDGTFLNSAKYAVDQRVIGVNTNPKKSVGFMTRFSDKNIEQLLRQLDFANPSFNNNYECWRRLSAKIDGVDFNQYAINEVFIGNLNITQTSHLDVMQKPSMRKSFVRGNGIVISTNIGSNAFYKSAGGTPFSINGVGYVMVLPYSIEGNLSSSEIYDASSTIEVIPKRGSDSYVSFDCDEKRQFNVKQGSVIEVGLDTNNCLKVLR